MPATIVIADDHALIASGLRATLESRPGLVIAGIAANGIEAIALIKKHRPDCAVLDMSMPGASGLEVMLESKRWSPNTRCVVVTGNPAPALFDRLIESGVDGIFLKSSDPDRICDGILTVINGGRAITPEVRALLNKKADAPDLTSRELEVLQGIARGYSNGRIAEVLGVSPKTVDSHRTSLMRKMGVRTVATLLVSAMRKGLIGV